MKNEAGRYLEACLSELIEIVDEMFVYDDRSNDESIRIARYYTDHVVERAPTAMAFLGDESKFREEAWQTFEEEMDPVVGDWVLSIDADEMVVSDSIFDLRQALRSLVDSATSDGAMAVEFPIYEVFGVDKGSFMVRKDGFWGSIKGVRLFAYAHNGTFSKRSMGCGSVPSYVKDEPWLRDTDGVSILHFGYLRSQDRLAKHERYSTREGHNPDHIRSILEPPFLEKWTGGVPVIGLNLSE